MPFDVGVYGDSPSAVTAAVQAARMGRSTCLAVPGRHVGGILVNGLGANDLDNHDFQNSVAVGGLAAEYYQRIAREYGDSRGFRTEPHVAEKVFNDLLEEAGVEVRLDRRLAEGRDGVERSDGRIQSLRFENGDRIGAAVFVDGTVEGDLMAFAGVSWRVGREGNAEYGESLNGVIEDSDYRQFTLRIDPYVVPGRPDSGVIHTVQDEPLGEPGSRDGCSMGFCYRMVLTDDPSNRMDVPCPEGFDPDEYEIYRRYFAAGGAGSCFVPNALIPNRKTDLGSWHDLSANLYGYSHGWAAGTYAEREQILAYHRRFTHGLVWWLQNDPEVPDQLAAAWRPWGLPLDEFGDNGHWPRQLYVRNGRRMRSDWVVTEADTRKGDPKVAEDPVAVAFWPPDMHHARRIVRDGRVWNEGFVFGKGGNWRPFGISYQAIRPKREDCLNLLVPSALSSSYVGYGAVRIEWTFMALGQSAGAAAALAGDAELPVQDLDYSRLERVLLDNGQVLRL